MANNDCLPQIQACAIRVAVLDSNGVPSPGANKLYTSDALTTLTLTPNYTDGETIEERNACGGLCVSYRSLDTLNWFDVELTICSHDPYLVEMLGQGDVLTSGGVRGYAFPPIGTIGEQGVSVELWAKRIDGGDLHAEWPYAWYTLPKLRNLRHGPRTFGNASQLPSFTGQAVENPNWFDGPLNDWPVASDRAVQWYPAAALPVIACGPTTLAAS